MATDPTYSLLAAASVADEATFVRRHGSPVLVLSGRGDSLPPDAQMLATARSTDRASLTPTPPVGSHEQPPHSFLFRLVPVVSQGRGPFTDVIALGRSPVNDIVLPHKTISKSHCFFRLDDDGHWTIEDNGSSNGTSVTGARLRPRTPRRLGASEMVSFGEVHAAWKLPGALYRFLTMNQPRA